MSDNVRRTLWSIGVTVVGYYIMTQVPGLGGIILATATVTGLAYVGNELMPFEQELAEGHLVNKQGANLPIPIVYGVRRIGGVRVAVQVTGDDNEYLSVVLAMCEGEVEAIEFLKYDERVESGDSDYGDSEWWEDFGGYYTEHEFGFDGAYYTVWHPYEEYIDDGFISCNKYVGTDSQSADTGLVDRWNEWTTAHKLSGIAYLSLRFKYDSDTWIRGVPTVTGLVSGCKVYDFRTATSVASSNPAVIIYDYLTNDRYGRGVNSNLIDTDSFEDCANYCDTEVEHPDGDGGTVMRPMYTCNAVMNTGSDFMTNMNKLLTSCRGMLVFSSGKYKLKMDKPEDASFAFTEDNITGSWEIHLGDIKSRFNRIKAQFVNPVSWQSDLTVADSEALRADDDDRLLERTLDLSCCTSPYEAYIQAVIALNASRQQLRASFTAFSEGLQCEVGDVVSITHSTPEWDAKEFRVSGITILSSDEVSVQVQEYDASTYEYGVIQEVDLTPNTNLPDSLSVEPPTELTVTESLYSTGDNSGIKAKAVMTWTASADAFIDQYEIHHKLSSDEEWLVVGRTTGSAMDVLEIEPAMHSFRVKAINRIGVSSDWNQRNQEMLGLTEPPSDVTDFSVANLGEFAMLTWSPMTANSDLDVRYGGHFVIRFSADTSPTWNNSYLVDESIAGSQNSTIVPLRSGFYFIKAVDSTGNTSLNAVSVDTDGAELVDYTILGSEVAEHPDFGGTLVNMTEDSGALSISTGETSGSYTFDTGIDAGSVQSMRLQPEASFEIINRSNVIDNRTEYIDNWLDFDGDDSDASGNVSFQFRKTNDNPSGSPAWSSWQAVFTGVAECRAVEFRLIASVDSVDYDIEITELTGVAHQISAGGG